jgi:hypothetical protein
LTFGHPFDAVVGRCVLQFQREPEVMLRQLAARVRRGGVVVFHEIDWGGLSSFPPVATYDQCARSGAEAMRLQDTDGEEATCDVRRRVLAAPTLQLEALAVGRTAVIAYCPAFQSLTPSSRASVCLPVFGTSMKWVHDPVARLVDFRQMRDDAVKRAPVGRSATEKIGQRIAIDLGRNAAAV